MDYSSIILGFMAVLVPVFAVVGASMGYIGSKDGIQEGYRKRPPETVEIAGNMFAGFFLGVILAVIFSVLWIMSVPAAVMFGLFYGIAWLLNRNKDA